MLALWAAMEHLLLLVVEAMGLLQLLVARLLLMQAVAVEQVHTAEQLGLAAQAVVARVFLVEPLAQPEQPTQVVAVEQALV